MFEWFTPNFMRWALFAVVLLAPLLGLMGSMVTLGRMAYFSDSLTHASLLAAGVGMLLGIADQTVALIIVGAVYALGIILAQERSLNAADTLIGVFSSAAMALGVVLLSVGGGFARYTSLLVGDLLMVGPGDIIALGCLLVLAIGYMALFGNKLMLVNLSPSLAHSRGVHRRWISLSFALLLAVVIMVCVRFVGTLVLNAMLILPAAAAQNATTSARKYMLLSIGISLGCGILGLISSYYLSTATGATIVLVLFVLWLITTVLKKRTIR